jgi:thiamine-phosphate pyrophosphorylase
MISFYIISPNINSYKQLKNIGFFEGLQNVFYQKSIKYFQLRMKDFLGTVASDADISKAFNDIKDLKNPHKIKFILNDNANLAKKLGFDGVHLGEDDVSILEAKSILKNKIIGVSCYNNLQKALDASKNGASYIAFGSFFETTTKATKYKADFSLIEQFRKQNKTTKIVAIGGINEKNIGEFKNTEANYIAVSNTIWQTKDYANNLKLLENSLN